jgi:hypothetical protein
MTPDPRTTLYPEAPIMHALLLLAALAADTDPAMKLEAATFGPYFESNKSGLKGEASYLAFSDAGKFAAVLRPVPPVGGRKTIPLPKDAFDKSLVLVVIRRGTQIHEYTVEKAEAKGDTVVLTFKSAAKGAAGGTATFASPLVVTVPKGKYKTVEFIENGKKAGTVKLGE